VEHFELVLLFLLLAVIGLTALSRVLGVPYPILLVVGGSALGFAPGVPDVELDPDLVLLLFLPPLLFNAAYFASVRDLRRSLRPISLTAVGLVLATMAAVAVAFHLAVPGVPWAVAFAFGAIVSPTDPLAAIAITQRLGVPRRVGTLIEGESLINDGTALVAYRTAVAAAVGGTFDLLGATADFVVNVAGGAVVGIAVAALLVVAFRRIRDDVLAITVSLAAGYVAYLPAEQLHVSGVIAAVTVGLILGHRAHELSGSGARLRGSGFWDVLVFLLNAVLFVLLGLQLPGILEGQDRPAADLAALGLLAGLVVIATRMAFTLGMPYVIRALDRRPSQRARRVGWRERVVAGWSGLRGAVSLAAALALPPGFPERDLIIFLTLCVIFATLVLQGLTLPALIRRLGIHDDGIGAREELHARYTATDAALLRLAELEEEEWTRDDTVERLRRLYEFRRRRLLQRAGKLDDDDEDLDTRSFAYQRLLRELYDAQRRELVRQRDAGAISSTVLHTIERELDLDDQRLEI
jgi:CPA1 family monovalent cation:H+ antiporter